MCMVIGGKWMWGAARTSRDAFCVASRAARGLRLSQFVAQTLKCCRPCEGLTFVRQKTSQRRQTSVCATRKRRRNVKSTFMLPQKRQSVAAMHEITVCATPFCSRNVKSTFLRQAGELDLSHRRQSAVCATARERFMGLFWRTDVKAVFLRRCLGGGTSPI